jgi:5-methylcytosine-specific restriction endonuclease McrA
MPKKGYKQPEELKIRRREIMLKRKEKLGYINSPETREKLRIANLGKKLSEETKEKIRITRLGKESNNKGKHWKVKNTTNLGKALIGRKRPPFSNEWKTKISISKRGVSSPFKGIKKPNFSRENHPNWISDRTQIKQYWIERNNPEYKQWRKNVLERDNYKCKICGEKYDTNNGSVVHHILPWKDYPEERYNINNGITLCQAHHPRKRIDEQMLIPSFRGMVEAISK